MSPLEIGMLLHIYGCHAPIPNVEFSSQCAALVDFQVHGLIRDSASEPKPQHGFELTERGLVYVEALMSLPLPVARWEIHPPPQPRCEVPR